MAPDDPTQRRLLAFLDQQEEDRRHGVTLTSVYRATRDVADQLFAQEQAANSRHEELRREIASLGVRVRNLESDRVALHSTLMELTLRVEEVERQLRLLARPSPPTSPVTTD